MREYHIFIGSVHFFEECARDFGKDFNELNEKVLEFDGQTKAIAPLGRRYTEASKLIVRNNHYSCLTEPALSRLGGLLEDLTTNDATILVHNPPHALIDSLQRQGAYSQILLDIQYEQRPAVRDVNDSERKIQEIKQTIIGQDDAISEITKSLLYLSKTKRKRPFVIMLYGGSGLGKTETAHAVAKAFFNGELVEQHLSMFETGAYADYFFGGSPNVRSLGFELNERASNLLFLDEMDKCPSVFRTAFYTLFDNEVYKDRTYDVDISGLLIFLTCNYESERDILKNLGEPIFYRIDKFIPYKPFSSQAIREIMQLEIEHQVAQMDVALDKDAVLRLSAHKILGANENGRTIKNKVREAIETVLNQSD
jgi:ATP-dependent Clp protease ATP-binding subunit ClpA